MVLGNQKELLKLETDLNMYLTSKTHGGFSHLGKLNPVRIFIAAATVLAKNPIGKILNKDKAGNVNEYKMH